MSEHSPNLNLNLYSEADSGEKFRSFVEKLAGPGADSNMMLLDAAIKAQAEKLKKAALLDGTGKLPDSLLPEIGAEHIPFVSSSLFQAAVGDASNVSEALENIGKVSADAYAHIENTNNPHGVTAEKINAVPVSRTINGQPLSNDITLTPSDIGITAKRTCRFVVGTSTAGWTADDCDFLCDGVDDDVELNQAIYDALSSGGGQEIVILRGKYNLSNPLEYLSDITLIGEMDTPCNYSNTWLNLASGINITLAGDRVGLRNLYILGGSVLAPQTGIGFCNFENCNARFEGHFDYSKFIKCNGYIMLNNSEHVMISQCTFPLASMHACSNVFFIGCDEHIEDNRGEISMTATIHSVISGNIVKHISLSDGCNDNVVIGNNILVPSVDTGIWVSASNRNAIIGNVVYLADSVDMPNTYTIRIVANSSYNLVADNLIYGKNYYSTGGTSNTFVNNKYN